MVELSDLCVVDGFGEKRVNGIGGEGRNDGRRSGRGVVVTWDFQNGSVELQSNESGGGVRQSADEGWKVPQRKFEKRGIESGYVKPDVAVDSVQPRDVGMKFGTTDTSTDCENGGEDARVTPNTTGNRRLSRVDHKENVMPTTGKSDPSNGVGDCRGHTS
jgi:hypothetical protein